MNKKKLLTLAMVLSMVAILVVGGTIAYFTDTDTQTNVFISGNVAIDLFEDFGDNNEETPEKLLPTTGKDPENKAMNINGFEKEVYVKSTGSEPAFVRVHIAMPDIVDSGAKDHPALNASDNIVHFNMAKESFAAGEWSWLPAYSEGKGYEDNVDSWNVYETKIGGINYNVYVVTYRTALEENVVTPDAIYQMYMDANTTNEQIAEITKELGTQWKVYVAAEACQAQGFDNAYVALNTTFGDPQAADYVSKVVWTAAPEGDKWVDTVNVKGF